MDAIHRVHTSTQWSDERPLPARRGPRASSAAATAPAPARIAPPVPREARALTVALRRLDRLERRMIQFAQRSARPFDARRAARDLRILGRLLDRAGRNDVHVAAAPLFAHLGEIPPGPLDFSELSVSSRPSFAQAELLLRRLETLREHGVLADVPSLGSRELRRVLTDVLSELPPVLDIEA